MWKLLVRCGEAGESDFPLTDELTIGREASNDLWLDDPEVSRRHARVFLKDRVVIVEDLNSANGVFRNGVKISGIAELKPGDVLLIGSNRMVITWSGSGPAPISRRFKATRTTDYPSSLTDPEVEKIIREKRAASKAEPAGRKTGCLAVACGFVMVLAVWLLL